MILKKSKYLVSTYRVQIPCPKCGAPSLEFTGLLHIPVSNDSTEYVHKCPSCGFKAELDKEYPAIEYEDVGMS